MKRNLHRRCCYNSCKKVCTLFGLQKHLPPPFGPSKSIYKIWPYISNKPIFFIDFQQFHQFSPMSPQIMWEWEWWKWWKLAHPIHAYISCTMQCTWKDRLSNDFSVNMVESHQPQDIYEQDGIQESIYKIQILKYFSGFDRITDSWIYRQAGW